MHPPAAFIASPGLVSSPGLDSPGTGDRIPKLPRTFAVLKATPPSGRRSIRRFPIAPRTSLRIYSLQQCPTDMSTTSDSTLCTADRLALNSRPSSPAQASVSGRVAVLGHRGTGSNHVSTTSIRENTVLGLSKAGQFGADGVEFDVQLTSDDVPVLFHDEFLLGVRPSDPEAMERTLRISDITFADFQSLASWCVESWEYGGSPRPYPQEQRVAEDHPCTLAEILAEVPAEVAFNLEIKVAKLGISHEALEHMVDLITAAVDASPVSGRKVVYSSFDPDACIMARTKQATYPVMMLTEAGTLKYDDVRRNSVPEAIKVALQYNLAGVCSHSEPLLKAPSLIKAIKSAGLALMTWGSSNNIPENVHTQSKLGVDGVICDNVPVIVRAVADLVLAEREAKEVPVDLAKGLPATTKPVPVAITN